MQHYNTSAQNYEYGRKMDEEMEEDDSWGKSFHVDFSPYRISPNQAGMSRTAGVSREMERV